MNNEFLKDENSTFKDKQIEKLTYEDYSEMFFLTGNFSYINSHGYLSADDFHTVDVKIKKLDEFL